jgi:hypothetical protein
VADAVEDQIVRKNAVVFEVGDLHLHTLDVVTATFIDGVDESPGKGVFHAEQDADPLLAHSACSPSCDPSMWRRIV